MNKKLLCTAVGASLTAASGLAQAYLFHETWAADGALIPYVVKDSNRTTVVTLIGNADGATPKETDSIHVQYWTKSTTDANTAACQPSSIFMAFTDEDIVTFDTAGILGYPLFGDSTNTAPLGAAISYPAPRHGYAMIWNGPDDFYSAYWLELDLANGGAHGDAGLLANTGSSTADLDDRFPPSLVLAANNGDPTGINYTAVPFWPSSIASTVFTVTPLGTNMMTSENNQMTVQVFNNNVVQGAYDRNENGVDGTVPVTVRCVGRVTPAQLMPGVVANAAWAAQGGWGYLGNLGDNATTTNDRDAVVYQVDTSSAGGKFMSNATRIVSCPGWDFDDDGICGTAEVVP